MDKYNKWLTSSPELYYYLFDIKATNGSGVGAEVYCMNDKLVSYVIHSNFSIEYFNHGYVRPTDDSKM